MSELEPEKEKQETQAERLETFEFSEREYYRTILSEAEWNQFQFFNAVLADNRQALLNSVGIGRALEVMALGPEEAIQYFDLNAAHVTELVKHYGGETSDMMIRIRLYETEKHRVR